MTEEKRILSVKLIRLPEKFIFQLYSEDKSGKISINMDGDNNMMLESSPHFSTVFMALMQDLLDRFKAKGESHEKN